MINDVDISRPPLTLGNLHLSILDCYSFYCFPPRMRLSLLLWIGLLSAAVANPILDDLDGLLDDPDYQGYI